MKTTSLLSIGCTAVALALTTACSSDPNNMRATNPNHPGPVVGQGVGTAVGAVGGNVAGLAVGFGEGVVEGAKAPFNHEKRIITRWRTETTADGRTIQVPEYIQVDQFGRPVGAVPPPSQDVKPAPMPAK